MRPSPHPPHSQRVMKHLEGMLGDRWGRGIRGQGPVALRPWKACCRATQGHSRRPASVSPLAVLGLPLQDCLATAPAPPQGSRSPPSGLGSLVCETRPREASPAEAVTGIR